MVHLFPRPAVATSIISLFSVINPVSAHVKSPLRPRAHAAAIQLRSFNAVDVDLARRENVPLEVRPLKERGLLDVVNGAVDGVNTLLGTVLGGGGSTTSSTAPAPANPTPAPVTTTVTQGSGGGNTGNTGNPGVSTVTVTNGAGNPTPSNPSNPQNPQNTQNTQNIRTNPSATASNPSQQTPKVGSITTTTTGKAPSPACSEPISRPYT